VTEFYLGFEAKYRVLGMLVVGPTSRPVFPTQPLAAGVGFLTFLSLLLLNRRRRFEGQLALVFVGVYSVLSFALSATEAERSPGVVGDFSASQLTALGMLCLVIVFWLLLRRRPHRDNDAI